MSVKLDEIMLANGFVLELIYEISRKYRVSLKESIRILTEIGYWKVLNDTELCCVLAHDGVKSTIDMLGEKINGILSRNR